MRSQDCLVSIEARLWHEYSAFFILVGARNFLLSHNIHTCSRSHQAPCSVGNATPCLGVKWSEVMLSTHLHLRGWVQFHLYSYMTTVLEGGEWSAARHGHTLSLRKTWYPLYRRLGGLKAGLDRWKILSHRDSIPGPFSP